MTVDSPELHIHAGGDQHTVVVAESKVPMWIQDLFNKVFALRKRNVTIELEIYCGIVQFISCLYVLPVVPFQMKRVGYPEESSIACTAITCCVGCIAAAFLTDMPLIVAPPTSVSIFLAVSMQQQGLGIESGNAAVIYSGIALTLIGIFPPIGRLIQKFIPDCIQAATSIGIGMMTALAGATEVKLVVHGKYTLVDMGELTDEVIIAVAAVVIVAAMLHYHVKGAFCTGLIFGTLLWWFLSGEYPEGIMASPITAQSVGDLAGIKTSILLILNLVFLYILTLNGLARSMSDLAGLTKPSGVIPRGNFLFISCGLTTILSGYFSGPPILISPESAAGIKAGAKTGLSTLVCGILFGISVFFWPVFKAVPAAGTAPLLIIVGVVLFNNVKRVDWTEMKNAVPAYCVLFFIPFTYSILRGVAFGYVMHFFLQLFTGEYITNIQSLWDFYTNPANYRKMLKDVKPFSELGGDDVPEQHVDIETTPVQNPLQLTAGGEIDVTVDGGSIAAVAPPTNTSAKSRRSSSVETFYM